MGQAPCGTRQVVECAVRENGSLDGIARKQETLVLGPGLSVEGTTHQRDRDIIRFVGRVPFGRRVLGYFRNVANSLPPNTCVLFQGVDGFVDSVQRNALATATPCPLR